MVLTLRPRTKVTMYLPPASNASRTSQYKSTLMFDTQKASKGVAQTHGREKKEVQNDANTTRALNIHMCSSNVTFLCPSTSDAEQKHRRTKRYMMFDTQQKASKNARTCTFPIFEIHYKMALRCAFFTECGRNMSLTIPLLHHMSCLLDEQYKITALVPQKYKLLISTTTQS